MANKLTSIDVPEVVRQSDITSKVVRDGRTNLKNKINEVIDELAAVSIGTTNAETTDARPYHNNLKERLDNKNATPDGGVVTVNAGDTSKVDITQFTGTINGIDVKIAAATSAAISAAAAGKHRVDVAVAQSDNTFVIVTGAEKTQATEDLATPSIATTQHQLAWLYVDDTGAVDLTNNIFTITQADAEGEHMHLVSGGTLDEQGTPDMTVKVAAGTAVVNQKYVTWTETNVRGITVPSANPRLDWIVVDEWGVVYRSIGTEAASPVFPSIPSNTLVLGALVTKTGTTSLNRGQQMFDFLNANNPYLPNLYINTAYTATNKIHNNVIIDMVGVSISSQLQCQGNLWIANYDGNRIDGTGDAKYTGSMGPWGYTDSQNWRLYNVDPTGGGGDTLTGSSGAGAAAGAVKPYWGNAGTGNTSIAITVEAFNVYVYNYNLKGRSGGSGSTEFDPNGDDATFPLGDFSVGSSGRVGDNGLNFTVEAFDNFEVISSINLSGGNGGNGGNASAGAVGNLGGKGGNSGNGGTLTYTCKTFTNNGTIDVTAGTAGTGGTGSGGSDNNGNGSAGSTGSAGTTTATLYDFTDGLPSNYGDWLLPIRNEKVF